MRDAGEVIDRLGLAAHPEGGWFRETWRDEHSTAIYYLLGAGERSQWHRVDAVEIWHFSAGDPLELSTSPGGTVVLRPEQPQHIVRRGVWQSARSLGAWSLVGCTVTPPFTFERFELAPPGWAPQP